MRKTKIVATVGPSCGSASKLAELIRAGVDVFRINASHTVPSELKKWVRLIRSVAQKAHKPVAILVDLQGPRVRTGSLKDGKRLKLRKNQMISIQPSSKPGDENLITTSCKLLPRMVKKGDSILLDNGMINLKVLSLKGSLIRCKVLAGGWLGENKGINIPNAPVTLPALSAKDKEDLKAALSVGVDYIALSFVRNVEDVMSIKRVIKKSRKKALVISKIEKPQAVKNIHEIAEVSDGMMVARGDLGIEMGVQKIPGIQKDLITEANRFRIPVITATQMLESMMHSQTPTRAEASDIANAVFDGTDAVMLSGETSIGDYPVEAVKMMAEIIKEAETHIGEGRKDLILEQALRMEEINLYAISHAARRASSELGAEAIVVYTMGGKTAVLISKFRPLAPIIALTESDDTARKLVLFRGLYALRLKYPRNTDQIIREGDKVILKSKLLAKGAPVVILSGRQALPGTRYMTKIHSIGEK